MSLFGCLANLVRLSGTNQCMFGSPYRSRSLAPQVQGGLHKRIGARSAGGRRARAQAAESRAGAQEERSPLDALAQPLSSILHVYHYKNL